MNVVRNNTANFYLYDPLDRLLGTNLIQRFYSGTRIATEIQGELKTSFFAIPESIPLAELHHGDATTLLATDMQKTVLHSVSSAISEPLIYCPYGHRSTKNGLISLLGFNGERPDSMTGNYMLGQGYRAFNPVLMRFNSPDSWSPFGQGGINAYTYCEGDPMNSSDPSGHMKFSRNLLSGITSWKAKAQINLMHAKAYDAKLYIDGISNDLARKFRGGTITPGLKTKERILEKAITSYDGDPQGIQDIARNTITVKKRYINTVVKTLQDRGADIYLIKPGSRADGYSGAHAFIKTPSGIWGEIQVQPPSMIYSRYSESIAKTALPSQHYSDLDRHARTHGYQGGLAHGIYEKARSPGVSLAQRSEAVRESREYYSFIRDGFIRL